MKRYAKTIAATLGAGAGLAVAVFAPHSLGWNIAESVIAVLTVFGVYQAPYNPKPPAGVIGEYVGNK